MSVVLFMFVLMVILLIVFDLRSVLSLVRRCRRRRVLRLVVRGLIRFVLILRLLMICGGILLLRCRLLIVCIGLVRISWLLLMSRL